MNTENGQNNPGLSGNPEAFSLQPNAINYAVESCYYLYGRILQEAKETPVAFDVLDAYGWINDFYTVNQESYYFVQYEGEYGYYTDTNINSANSDGEVPEYDTLIDSGILKDRIDELADDRNIMGAFLLEFDEYGRISKVEFVGAGDIACDQNLYAKARESVVQYEQNADIYEKMYSDKAGLDMQEVLPRFEANRTWMLPVVDKENLLQYVEAQDLRAYGLIPEIIGRLPVITYLDHLDKVALKRILTEPKNALMRQYEKMFALDGIKLTVEPEVLDLIVDTSIENRLGARGLRSICEAIMTDAMYDAPSSNKKTFKLTLEYAKKKLAK